MTSLSSRRQLFEGRSTLRLVVGGLAEQCNLHQVRGCVEGQFKAADGAPIDAVRIAAIAVVTDRRVARGAFSRHRGAF
ncbi:MAG: hypothetical protein JWL71_4928 [Acidobacteria bacterium]|nr:hypothetical protein [Acidobacteriota bacterium]